MSGTIRYMNTRKKGYYRDREVKNSIELFEILTPEQICILHFKQEIKKWDHAMNKTRERLRSMDVKRSKLDIYGKPYCYYYKKPKNILHAINRNWGIIYLSIRNKWMKIDNIKHEYRLGGLQADSFIRLKNYNKYFYWFIESERHVGNNKFIKIENYNKLYASNDWENEYWNIDNKYRPDNFPKILIISDNNNDIVNINKAIKLENINNLVFNIVNVDKIRKKLLGGDQY